MTSAVVIGAGPAGLMAAEVMARAGLVVTVVDAMPSVGRKFLMAGKSGLNLTKDVPLPAFLDAYGPLPFQMQAALRDFDPGAVMDWARGLGQPVFTGSTGRVFPVAMKASPLLRAWMIRLGDLGVTLQTHWRWQGWEDGPMLGSKLGHARGEENRIPDRHGAARKPAETGAVPASHHDQAPGGRKILFDTPSGPVWQSPDVTVLALGGASWARLGSDGGWVRHLPTVVAPFKPANMGFVVDWSPQMAPFFGSPVKGCALTAGGRRERGEFVISAQGIEGGGIYAISRAAREGAALFVDLAPDLSVAEVRSRLASGQGKATLSAHLRKALKLGPEKRALLQEFGRPFPPDLAPLIKALPVRHAGPRPMDQAISTAGGVRFDALDAGLMLSDRPGVFIAGEMLDWEAPTGGYLITGCLATGRLAGLAAARWVGMGSTTADA